MLATMSLLCSVQTQPAPHQVSGCHGNRGEHAGLHVVGACRAGSGNVVWAALEGPARAIVQNLCHATPKCAQVHFQLHVLYLEGSVYGLLLIPLSNLQVV